MTAKQFLARQDFKSLLQALKAEAYSIIAPQVRDNAIVYEKIENISQLPRGILDIQAPGSYKLENEESERWFAWANGPQALKPLLFSPEEVLWSAELQDNKLAFKECAPDDKSVAVIGVRACDLAALDLQDKHFLQKEYSDAHYQKRRENILLIAVNCSHPADTCFCVSTGDGPFVSAGYDIVLTELEEGFLINPGSDKGSNICDQLPLCEATDQQTQQSFQQLENAINRQQRKLPNANLAKLLPDQLEHKQWDDIALRCLSCGNCTAVCPSCFCHSELDEQTLDGLSTQHIRQWDSCFNLDHSYIHGITIRAESKTRYRQWLTHKFAYWVEQYGRSGCVGCGRCITWCPVGIDVVQELKTIAGEANE